MTTIDYIFDKDHCFVYNQKILVVRDESKKKPELRFESQNNFISHKYKIDEGVLTQREGIQCDWYVYLQEFNKGYLIELKGSDFLHACRQLSESIDKLKIKSTEFIKIPLFGRIVLNKVITHDQKNPEVLKLKEKLRCMKGDFEYSSQKMIIKI